MLSLHSQREDGRRKGLKADDIVCIKFVFFSSAECVHIVNPIVSECMCVSTQKKQLFEVNANSNNSELTKHKEQQQKSKKNEK